jgi:hypothetical protein
MRSVDAPRVSHDASVEIGVGGRARAVNLSTGGIFVKADEPLDPGALVHLRVDLRDGASPVDVDGEVVWRANGGMALRFLELDELARRRIQRLVQKREPTISSRRDVRIHLPSLPSPLRATARDMTERGIMIEAELPWLRLGSPVTTELSPERACDGHVQWIGLDVTRAGSARLRVFIDLGEEGGVGEPPPSVTVALGEDAPAAVGAPAPRRRSWGWMWQSLALLGVLGSGVLATALLKRPPMPLLLPSAPPERDAPVARVPPKLSVPAQKTEAAAKSSDTAPQAAPAKPASSSTHGKKRSTAGRHSRS